MPYWLCVTTEENCNVIRENNIWGVPAKRRNTIAKTKVGDKCLIYVTQTISKDKEITPPRIVAIYEVASEVFEDKKRLFKSKKKEEIYPLRVKLKPIKIFQKPVDFKSLIPKLKFIKNKQKWTGHIQGRGMIEIPEEDFLLILKRG